MISFDIMLDGKVIDKLIDPQLKCKTCSTAYQVKATAQSTKAHLKCDITYLATICDTTCLATICIQCQGNFPNLFTNFNITL